MSNEYLGSERHVALCLDNIKKGKTTLEKQRQDRVEVYNANPNYCNFCKKILDYNDRHKKYCNTSCSAKYNNVNRTCKKYELSEEGLKNIREANRKNKIFSGYGGRNSYCRIKIVKCAICEKLITQKKCAVRKTCSNQCRTLLIFADRKYQNKKKIYQPYFNKWVNKDVLLESSWEKITAEKLDELNIKWERPKFIRWKDSSGKGRLYFPDFYLNDYNVYLDPKNPYCMKQDEEKMKIVAKDINIEFGDIAKIINFIKTIN
jgi:hypothetical protein